MNFLHLGVWQLLLLGVVTSAQAQLALRPLPPTRPVGIMFGGEVGRTTGNSLKDDQLSDAAIKEVERTLHDLGYDVVPRADVIQSLIALGVNCPKGVQNCDAKEVLKALKLGGVVVIAIWWARPVSEITVEITGADAVGKATGKLEDEVRQYVPGLVVSALEDMKNGKAVEVQVHTLPLGAQVKLDGELLGLSPAKAKVWPGSHEALVSYPHYVSTSKHFEVPRGADSPLYVHVALERVSGRAAQVSLVPLPQRTQPTAAWDYLLGTGLGVAGVAAMISPVTTLARAGECTAGADRYLCEHVSFRWREGLQMAGGLLAIASAPLIFATTPIRASLSTTGDSVHAQIQGSF